ncbi:MAG: hypothetical protein ABI315_03385 [Bacteroidia bacterium]
MEISEIDPNKIPEAFFEFIELQKFNLWPIIIDKVKYGKQLFENSSNVKIFACYKQLELIGILSLKVLEYDTTLFGFPCALVDQVIVNSNLSGTERKEMLQRMFLKLQEYRKEENIKFCSISVNSWNTQLADAIQDVNFKYILTWADCFYNYKKIAQLPIGYEVRQVTDEKDLPLILEMTKDYFKGGRFFLDEKFPFEKSQQMYFDLVKNSFYDPKIYLIGLYKNEVIIGCFIYREGIIAECKAQLLRFLVFNKKEAIKGLATNFLIGISNLLGVDGKIVVSGIEVHNLASLKIHTDAGYKFNNVHSAYHSWI